MPSILFIYGTLHPARAPREIAAAARRLEALGPATIHAHVYNLGEYPAAILDPAAPPIPGELFIIPDAATLTALDAYEDHLPTDPTNSLFLRVETIATTPDGLHHPCWVYIYNREVPGSGGILPPA